MGETIIKLSEDHTEASVLFTALIANPSTGKSQTLSIFQKALRNIEVFNRNLTDENKRSKMIVG
jgi:hypothetical protein